MTQARKRAEMTPEQRRAKADHETAKRTAAYETLAGRPKPECCDLCGGKPSPWAHRGLVFDHCHQSGIFRGWLCDRCNRTLGQVKDSPDLLRKMATYLEQHNGETHSEATEGDAGERVCRSRSIIPGQ